MKRVLLILSVLIFNVPLLFGQEYKTDISVHDPVIIRQNGVFHIYCTGFGISNWSSADMVHWKREKPVFAVAPQWAVDSVPGFKNIIWAPDISYYNGQYYLYYAVSAFGKNTSCIGLATNKTLNTNDSSYKWIDRGCVIASHPYKDNWNAIDPNLITDKNDEPYLVFGSFWGGLKIIKLSNDRLSVINTLNNIPPIATRKTKAQQDSLSLIPVSAAAGNNAIEAPFIFRKGRYFYLFASIDYCCRGPKSTYKMIIGRSKKILGPYVDKQGVMLKNGGGSILLAGNQDWYGVGHNAVYNVDGIDYIIFHGYDANDKAIPKLRIEKLQWINNWPVVQP